MKHFQIPRIGKREFLLLFVSIVFSLILIEIVLYFIGIKIPSLPVTSRPELYQLYEPHGYRLWPSRATTYLYPHNNPRKLLVVSNTDGFRSSRELDEIDDQMRILVVGDSFVFGEGVKENERFTDILETMLPMWRVDNLGMPGYGPDLMLRALEDVGLKTHPNIVLFCMITDDFSRVHPYYAGAGFRVKRFKLEHSKLITIPYPKIHFWNKSHIYGAISKIYWNYSNAIYDLNKAILEHFLKLSEQHNFMPVIIFLPSSQDLEIDKQHRTWLQKYAEENNTPFLDLTNPILSAGTRQVFITNNWHYNPYGHQIVATEIQRFLGQIGLE